MNCHKVVGAEPWSCGRAASVLPHWTIFPAPLKTVDLIVSELIQFYCDINITSKSIVCNLYNFEKIKGIFYSAALIKSHQLGDLQKKKQSPQFWRLGNPRLRFSYLRFLEMTHLSKVTPFGESFTKALGPDPFHNCYVFMAWSILKGPSF